MFLIYLDIDIGKYIINSLGNLLLVCWPTLLYTYLPILAISSSMTLTTTTNFSCPCIYGWVGRYYTQPVYPRVYLFSAYSYYEFQSIYFNWQMLGRIVYVHHLYKNANSGNVFTANKWLVPTV